MFYCKKCKDSFELKNAFVNHKKHCGNTKKEEHRHHVNEYNIDGVIVRLTARQIKNQFDHLKNSCAICGWNEASCDKHHIIPGKHDLDNLIIVCPNHHRIIHQTKKYSIEFLKEKSFTKILDQWTDFKQRVLKVYQKLEKKHKRLEVSKKFSDDVLLKIKKIQSSNIDFTKFGWVKEIAKILNVKPQKVNKWMRMYMPEFYEKNCFKRQIPYFQLDDAL